MADAKIRLFVAVQVPEELRAQLDDSLADLKTSFRNARWVAPENQHLTLKFLGWAPADRADAIASTCRAVAASRAPARMSLTELGAFPSTRRVRVLWVGIDDPEGLLARLATDLDGAFESLGFPSEGRPYTAHLTIARFKLPVPLKGGFPERRAPAHEPFEVHSIELFRSHLSPKGARYEVVESFPLGSPR